METSEREENFVEVRCKICHKFICEVSVETTGAIRRKCEKCKRQIKISLPFIQKTNTIFAGKAPKV